MWNEKFPLDLDSHLKAALLMNLSNKSCDLTNWYVDLIIQLSNCRRGQKIPTCSSALFIFPSFFLSCYQGTIKLLFQFFEDDSSGTKLLFVWTRGHWHQLWCFFSSYNISEPPGGSARPDVFTVHLLCSSQTPHWIHPLMDPPLSQAGGVLSSITSFFDVN